MNVMPFGPDDEEDDEDLVCVGCGCSNLYPCPGGCVWARDNLCSRCI